MCANLFNCSGLGGLRDFATYNFSEPGYKVPWVDSVEEFKDTLEDEKYYEESKNRSTNYSAFLTLNDYATVHLVRVSVDDIDEEGKDEVVDLEILLTRAILKKCVQQCRIFATKIE